MNLFEEIVKESGLLTEISHSREGDVLDAVKNMKRMRISYDDRLPGLCPRGGRPWSWRP